MAELSEKELLRKILETLESSGSRSTGARPSRTTTAFDPAIATDEEMAKADEAIEKTNKRIEALNRLNKTRSVSKEIENERLKLEQQQIDKDKIALELDKERLSLSDEQYERRRMEIKQREELLDLKQQEIEQTEKEIKAIGQATLSFLGLDQAMRKVTTTGMIEAMGELNKISTEIAQTGTTMGNAYAGFFDTLNPFDLTTTNKSLGVFVGQVADAEGGMKGLTQYGAGFKEINESVMGLRMSMAGFSDESAMMQNYLAGNATKMKNLGVSAEEQGKSLNFLTKSLGLSSKQASDSLDKLGKVAISAGIPVKNLLRDFGQIGPQLAAQGPKAVEIFGNLAKQAKHLGVEVSDLMGVVGSSMDTFEGAATAAGKFNAAMGGDYLNAMQLLNATEDERVEIIKRSMDATGKNFATMSKHEKIMVANTLGVKDINTAQMMLSGSTEEMRRKQEKQAATQEELNKLQAEAVDIATKLGSVFQVVYGAMLPFLEGLKWIADGLLALNDKGKGIPGVTIVGLLMARFLMSVIPMLPRVAMGMLGIGRSATGAVGPITAFGNAWAKAETKMGKFGLIVQAFLAILPLLIMLGEAIHDTWAVPKSPILIDIVTFLIPKGLDATGNAMARNVKPILAFGAAMLLVGGGIYLASKGLGEFVKSFKDLNTQQLIVAGVALIAFGFGMEAIISTMSALALSGVGEAGVLLMIAFGAAVALVGVGVWLAAKGVGFLVEKIKDLSFKQGASLAGSLLLIAGGITALMVALMGFAVGGLLGGTVGLFLLSRSISKIGSALEDFPLENSIKFTASLDSLRETLKEVKATTDADIQPTIKLMNAVKEYAIVKEKTSDDDPLVKLLKEIRGLLEKTSSASASEGGQEIVLKVDNDVLAKAIRKNMPKQVNKGASELSYGV